MLCLAAAMALATLAACAHFQRHDSEDDFLWEMSYGENSIIIIAYIGNNTDVRIPSMIEELPVTEIGPLAFERRNLLSVSIPNTVTSIGSEAFAGNRLNRVIIPDSVTYIGYGAFAINQLNRLTIPDSVTHIGYGAFASNRLNNLNIGSGIDTIGYATFLNNLLTGVIIPDNIVSIGNQAFASNQIRGVAIPDSVGFIGEQAFAGNHLAAVTIGSGVQMIDFRAFADNRLTNVTFGENLVIIGEQSFAGNRLRTLVIPDSVTYIGEAAFADNRIVNIAIGTGILPSWGRRGIDDSVIGHLADRPFLDPEEVIADTHIGNQAFAANRLTSVTIGSRVTSVGEGAFALNPSLVYVTIPDGLRINGNAFIGSSRNLSWVSIGENVELYGLLDVVWAGFDAFYRAGGNRPGIYVLRNNGMWNVEQFR